MARVPTIESSDDHVAADQAGSVAWSPRTALGCFLERPSCVQTLFWFVVILLLKHENLFEPPVWDSAMGVFPPAIYLYENHFDIVMLLQQASWAEGGPNVHSLSLLTWFIALVMKMTDVPELTFLIVHLVTFGIFAWALTRFTSILRAYGLAPHTVLAAAFFLLLIPTVLVQVGSMYTESLVLCTSVGAWASWREGRLGSAVLFCVVGIFLKLTGLVIAALIGMALLFSGKPYDVRKILLILSLPLALWINLSLSGWLGAAPQTVYDWGEVKSLMATYRTRMQAVPDVLWVMRIGLFSAAGYLVVRVWKDRNIGVLTRFDPDSRSRLICLAMPLLFMLGVLAMIHGGSLFLNRYLLPILPFAIGATLLFASRIRGETVAFVLLVGGCVLSLANSSGRFYQRSYKKFSVVERSHAYRDFHAVQKDAIEALSRKPDHVPAFVSREVDYMTSHRMMGYVDGPIPNTYPIYAAPYSELSLDQFPEEFILVESNYYHGGKLMRSLLGEVRDSTEHVVTERVIERKGFRAKFHEVKRVRGPGEESDAPLKTVE